MTSRYKLHSAPAHIEMKTALPSRQENKQKKKPKQWQQQHKLESTQQQTGQQ